MYSTSFFVGNCANMFSPRPHLISSLYEGLGAPCTQCGRRFQSDPESKKKKAAHMDWHFHVRQRMDEAEARGQHRSWYVDELVSIDPSPHLPNSVSHVYRTGLNPVKSKANQVLSLQSLPRTRPQPLLARNCNTYQFLMIPLSRTVSAQSVKRSSR